ncbi:tRNA (adenosine(37)-N6)-dimethylallyltransferase MiaA [Salinibacterium sp. SYSU T00001]|uniref:tRNA (adenosine(37)-N6)-dimethylallyltransferase MiaA n=1 Tax=Homoserinimonas sedimenticola TaxID=2986805 RepID=UPI0022360FC5|nr:tRNA (adenosine(37)-N6)-dimethylallyltransferase MiaA [Salinibacterium sedimenticola]MCW4386771.1 tRNA (adenosine(37)-N6)-dimethylallyltransferase MiaA [Salinibacterium sedimenticola]
MASAERPLIVIVGATGTGKSELSLDIAERLGQAGERSEIVNADAMQLYRGMDVGTAKLAPHERRGIRHHMLDVLEVDEEASVAAYQEEARSAIASIAARGATPILVGGSGLYISSVLFDFRFPGTDPVVRSRLESELESAGPGVLFARLRERDPEAAASIGPHNGRRIVRALEVNEITGQPFGAGLPEDAPWWPDTRIIALEAPRDALVRRLDDRVERMWSSGLLTEVSHLIEAGIERGVTARRAIGYAQAIGQLRGELDEATAIEQTQSLTRRYARRQVGWFRRYRHASWLGHDDPERVDAAMRLVLASSSSPVSLRDA